MPKNAACFINEKTHKGRWRWHIASAAFAIFVAAPIGYMAADRDIPFMLSEGVTHPTEIIRGQQFQLEWSIVIKRRCEANVWSVIRADVNNKLSFESVSTTAKQPSLFGEAPIELEKKARIIGRLRDVPANLPLGDAIIEVWQEAFCNPLQRLFDWPIVWKQEIVHTKIVDKAP